MRKRSVEVACVKCGRICAGVESQINVGRFHVRRHKSPHTGTACLGYLTTSHLKIERNS